MAFTTFQSLQYPQNGQMLLEGDEYLNITPAGAVYASGLSAAIVSHGVGGNSEVDLDGYVSGFDGVSFSINDINNIVRIGPSGRIVAPHIGVLFNSGNTGTTDDLLDNAGSISGSLVAVLFHGDGNTVYNSGRMSGGVALELQAGLNDTVQNLATGVMTGKTVIHATGAGHTITNHGQMIGSAAKAVDLEAGGTLDNYGTISGSSSALFMAGSIAIFRNHGSLVATQTSAFESTASNILLANDGDISALDNAVNIHDNAGGLVRIKNRLGGKIETLSGTGVAINSPIAASTVENAGTISGGMILGGASNLVNVGDIFGSVSYNGGGQTIRNSGHISGQLILQGAGGDLIQNSATGVIDNRVGGSAILQQTAGGSLRLFNAGEILGGVGSLEQGLVTNTGTIAGNVSFNSQLTLYNKGLIDGQINFGGASGNLYYGVGGTVTGTIFGHGTDGRYYGGGGNEDFDMTFNGAKAVFGGDGDDTFRFTASGLNAKTAVGGDAGDDSLTFTTSGTIARTSLTHVSGIEVFNLGAGQNSIALTDALASTAEGGALTVNGNAAVDIINGQPIANSAYKVNFNGAGGKDQISASAGADTFIYNAVTDSTGANADLIFGANLSVDRFDVSAVVPVVAAINTAVNTGALSTATFNTDLAAAIGAGQLSAKGAVLFTPNSGTLASQTFLVVDANNLAGYQANADLVFNLASATGTLALSTFI